MSYWLYFDGANPFYDGQDPVTLPYPPCNQAAFTVNANSHLTITGIGQGVLSWAQVTAQPGSTVNITLTDADWGLLWAEIDVEDGDELDITVQGEGVLWETIIKCPPYSSSRPMCKVNLVTDPNEASDYILDHFSAADDLYLYDFGGGGYFYDIFDPLQTGQFVTASMTKTYIEVDQWVNIEVNCDGFFDNKFFSDVEFPEIQITQGTVDPCDLEFTVVTQAELTLECASTPGPTTVPGTCNRVPAPVIVLSPTSSPTASPTTSSPTTSSPTASPTVLNGSVSTIGDSVYDLTVGMTIDSSANKMSIDVIFNEHNDQWFGFVFNDTMNGDAVIYTTGKAEPNPRVLQRPVGLYSYVLNGKDLSLVLYDDTQDWTSLLTESDSGFLRVVFEQDLDLTPWNASTTSVQFRYAIGNTLTLEQHQYRSNITYTLMFSPATSATAAPTKQATLVVIGVLALIVMICGLCWWFVKMQRGTEANRQRRNACQPQVDVICTRNPDVDMSSNLSSCDIRSYEQQMKLDREAEARSMSTNTDEHEVEDAASGWV